MPTVIAIFNGSGIALMIRSRTPEAAMITMHTPSSTTRPKACAHVMVGAIWKATTPLTPRPAAIASGALPTRPMRTVITPAASAVAVVISAIVSRAPVMSADAPRISGFSSTMYDIATNVVMPPRTSRPNVLPRSVMRKNRSRRRRFGRLRNWVMRGRPFPCRWARSNAGTRLCDASSGQQEGFVARLSNRYRSRETSTR